MRHLRTLWAPLLGLCISLAGCPGEGGDAEPYREGRIRIANKAIPVVPFVGATPQMDLFVQCKMAADQRREAGEADAVPCYEPEPRAAFAAVRVEHREGMTTGQAMGLLRPDNEASHFIVDRSGSLYQTLDLAYAARRAGAPRPNEVRVLSGNQRGHDTLVAALKSLRPALTVEVVEAPAAPSKPKETPNAPDE